MCAHTMKKRGDSMQALAEANVGEDYTIKWMFGVPEVLDLMAK